MLVFKTYPYFKRPAYRKDDELESKVLYATIVKITWYTARLEIAMHGTNWNIKDDHPTHGELPKESEYKNRLQQNSVSE